MRIQFWGHEFDLFDEKMRNLAANQAAVDKMQSIAAGGLAAMTQEETLINALEELLTNILSYWLISGATLQIAQLKGCEGITIAQAIEMHNCVGDFVGQKPMEIVALQPPANDAKG